MASSPLTLALLGQGQNALALTDPATARAAQKLGLAQSMISQGLDSSPAYPMQGLGRLAQAIVGTMLMGRGTDELEGIGNQRASDTQNAITNMMAPLQGLGQSPAPAATMVQPQPKIGGGAVTAKGTPFVASNLPDGVTPQEDQIVRTVWGEANGEPLAGQQAVASVIQNRAKGSGQSTQDVIFAPNQFEPWNTSRRSQLESLDPTSPDYQRILTQVVRPVMSGQAQDPTGGATHFLNPALVTSRGDQIPAWASGDRTTIGHHDFYYGGYGPRQAGGDGRVQVAQAGNVATDASPVAGNSPAQGVSSPQIGLNSPAVQAAMEVIRRAQTVMTDPRNRYNPQVIEAAKLAIDQAKMMMGVGKFVRVPGGQVDSISNEFKPDPVPRVATTESGDIIAVGPGGEKYVISKFDPASATVKTQATSPSNLPLSPEREQQNINIAQAGRPSVEQKVFGEGAGAAMKNVADQWTQQIQAVRDAAKREGQLQMFEQAMPAFDTGAASDVRLKAQQALSELGFKTNAGAGELMKGLQRQLELANTPKGQGQITENERVLIREGVNLFGSTPEGARLLIGATRALNDFERQVAQVYTDSAKRNGGTPNPVEVAEGIQNLPPPLPPAIENQIVSRIEAEKAAKGGGGRPAAGNQQPDGQAPVPGARQAPDGNWYVADPKRPGKYLQVQ